LRLFVAGAPLSLDFGIPLTTDRFNDDGNQFNFSFGTRF
jgi:outer membrane protein insertion porin family